MSESDQRAHAFAETVRKQTIHIAALIGAGKHTEAAEAVLSLCSQAAARKKELEKGQASL